MSKSGSALTFYYHLISQPSRALKILLDVNHVTYTGIVVNLLQGEHYQEDFTKINKFRKVPVIKHEDFILTESVAIVRYLCRETNIADNWYPKDSIKQAKVDEFLEWQHIELRVPCALYAMNKFLKPLLSGKPPNQERLNSLHHQMVTACNKIEDVWVKDSHYICGEYITVADLFAACELEQPKMAGYDPRNGRPKLTAWLNRIEEELNPFYTDAHKYLNEIVKKHNGVVPETISKL
ncbi:glutathione S-transferase theta-1-like [Lycorma delicatula]|uniref:glutathione S-transferase theta-1-like n=1 Tax=Lycorma delicatula TaxID=130591 RepID=UPI003F516C43